MTAEEQDAIHITDHAVQRFVERFRPALDLAGARAELERLVAVGDVRADPPGWLAARAHQWAPAYLWIGDDCVLPLVPASTRRGVLSALTCLDRNGVSDAARAMRARRRLDRTRGRRR